MDACFASDRGVGVIAEEAHPHDHASHPRPPGALFRVRSAHGHHRVTYVELFFDLVFVFAITQVSHTLLEDFTSSGVLRAGFLMLAVWWVWVYTSWITNWLDPERTPVRLLLFALMIAGIGLSTSLPEAFGPRGLTFAIAYSGAQVGRTLFMLLAIRRSETGLYRNFQRILAWVTASCGLWISGGLTEGSTRVALWAAALGVEYVGPALRFRTPGLGASNVSDWAIEGGHFAERCALFVIIALGESIVVTGATFAKVPQAFTSNAAFATAFIGAIAMWWIYFDRGVDHGAERLQKAANPGQLARLAYTYLHLPIVAGIVLAAVANELVLAHPLGHVALETAIAIVGGPLLYLVGVQLFKYAIRDILQLSHLIGVGLFGALIPFATKLSPLALSGSVTGILLLVAIWESISLRRGPLRSRREQRERAAETRAEAAT